MLSGAALSAASAAVARLEHEEASLALVDDLEMRRDIGLERKEPQQPLGEGVQRLDLEPARRLDRAGEQLPSESELRRAWRRRAAVDDRLRQGLVVEARPSASWLKMRSAMLAAAALVKVRQRICAGGVPSSSRRTTRWVSTWVLPLPALADTQAEVFGFEARAWRSRKRPGMARAAAHRRVPRFLVAARDRPFLDPREMVVIGEAAANLGNGRDR